MKKMNILLLAIFLLAISVEAFATTVTVVEQLSVGVYASDDAPVYDANEYRDTNFDNYGTGNPTWAAWASLDSELWTGNFDGLGTRSYLKFMAPDYPGAIQSATLWMYAGLSNGASDVSLYYVPTNAWEGNQITWNNQPDLSTFTLVNTSAVSQEGWRTWDVTELAQNSAGDYISLALVAGNGDPGTVFYGSETGTGFAPYINAAIVTPEPISSALFLLGGAGLVAFRRFKRKS